MEILCAHVSSLNCQQWSPTDQQTKFCTVWNSKFLYLPYVTDWHTADFTDMLGKYGRVPVIRIGGSDGI